MLIAHLQREEREAEGQLEVLVWGSSSILHTSLDVSHVINGAASWLIMSLRSLTVHTSSIMLKVKKINIRLQGLEEPPGCSHCFHTLLLTAQDFLPSRLFSNRPAGDTHHVPHVP